MVRPIDPRKVVGNYVKTKAKYVHHISECARRYGNKSETYMLQGVVEEVVMERSATAKRASTKIKANYDLGTGEFRRATINLASVQRSYIGEDVNAEPQPTAPAEGVVAAVIPAVNAAVDAAAPPPIIMPPIPPTPNNNQHNTNNIILESINGGNQQQTEQQTVVNNNDTVNNNQNNDNDNINNNDITNNDDNNNNNDFEFINNTPIASPASTTDSDETESEAPRATQTTRMAPSVQSRVLATAHGLDWFATATTQQYDINGAVPYREWAVRDPATGSVYLAGCNENEDKFSRLSLWLIMFPPNELKTILFCTNINLRKNNIKQTTIGEIIKLFGVFLLITKYEFQSRRSLWSSSPSTKYEVAPGFGKTGMSRDRFDKLLTNLRFSKATAVRPEGMGHETWRWRKVDDFVEAYNSYRKRNFIPSDLLTVDESMSRWYGIGGDYINKGLPMYVAIDRKPENGCEIQNVCCGRSGVMLQIKIVKTSKEQQLISLEQTREEREQDREREGAAEDESTGLPHGAVVLCDLVSPWYHSNRLVCADSYFSSVAAAQELKRNGLRYIGVVKTATKKFPMEFLKSRILLGGRGERYGLVANDSDGQPSLLSFVWVDRERRYFIATAGSLAPGADCVRYRWRQEDKTPDAEPVRKAVAVPQPRAAEMYYSCCAKIDQHNRDRQDTLMLERKLKTKDWSVRVNMTILGMIFVDTWKVWQQFTYANNEAIETQKTFYGTLAAEMIDNTYDKVAVGRNKRQRDDVERISPAVCRTTGAPRAGVSIHLTPTKKQRKKRDGTLTVQCKQGYCCICGKKTTHECSACEQKNDNKSGWCCHSKTGRQCFPEHIQRAHME
jgi:Transposase IS4